MKNFLYLMTMLFNIAGIILTIYTVIKLKTLSFPYFPIIILGIIIFSLSFGITYLDYHYRNSVKHELLKRYMQNRILKKNSYIKSSAKIG